MSCWDEIYPDIDHILSDEYIRIAAERRETITEQINNNNIKPYNIYAI